MQENQRKEQGEPFFPNHMIKEIIVAYLTLGVLLVLVAILPPHLHAKADPMVTPHHIKPEWYFLPMYQFLKLFPPQIPVLSSIPVVKIILGEGRAFSIIIQGLAMGMLLLIPFLDRNPEKRASRRPFAIAAGIMAIAGWAFFTIWGQYS